MAIIRLLRELRDAGRIIGVSTHDARLVPVGRPGGGQYFGELGPLLGYPRSASARAHTDVRLTSYGPQEFRAEVLGG